MAEPTHDGPIQFPELQVPPPQSKQDFLASFNQYLQRGFQVATIDDLRAKRFQKGAEELTEENLSTHVLVEPAIFANPSSVQYTIKMQDGVFSWNKEPSDLDEALRKIADMRLSWSSGHTNYLIGAKIEVYRKNFNHI